MIPHSRPTLGSEEKKACLEVLDSLQIAQGERVASFERSFSELVGRRYAVAVSSGTSALVLSLMALDISRGDEVVMPSYTCVALLHAVRAVGAEPVLVDIEPADFNISVSYVKKKIGRRTQAILVPHAFGRASRMKELLALGVNIIEDGTQALGAQVGEEKVGSFGILSLFSFYATKMMTTGEGGMILTDSKRLADKLYDLRDYDKKNSYRLRTNSKMTDLEAAIGIEQLKKLPFFISRRREIAARYQDAIRNGNFITPTESAGCNHVYFRYVLRIRKGLNHWIKGLKQEGIEAKKPVFKPLHQYLELSDKNFPETVAAMREACSLPIFPSLSDEECGTLCRAIMDLPLAKQKNKKAELVT